MDYHKLLEQKLKSGKEKLTDEELEKLRDMLDKKKDKVTYAIMFDIGAMSGTALLHYMMTIKQVPADHTYVT
jgi:phage gp16-like protein